MPPPPIDIAIQLQIIALARVGASVREIAREVGVSAATVSRYGRPHFDGSKVAHAVRARQLTRAVQLRIAELAESGGTIHQIARQLNISPASVSRYGRPHFDPTGITAVPASRAKRNVAEGRHAREETDAPSAASR